MCFIFKKNIIMTVHIVSPRISVHALISENRMFWRCFEMILCSDINACTFFRKVSATPFLWLCRSLCYFKQLCHQFVSLKIRVCDNSHSKLYNNVRFAVHTLYMMHLMLNYSHSNPVDTPLKKLVKSISKPPIKDKRNIDNAEKLWKTVNFEFSHDELNDIYLYCFSCNA